MNRSRSGLIIRSCLEITASGLVCRARTEDYGGRTRSHRDGSCVRLLSAPWADPCDYAVEFSDLAAHTYGHPDNVGWQRRPGKTLTQHATKFTRVRACHAGSRLPGRCFSKLDPSAKRR